MRRFIYERAATNIREWSLAYSFICRVDQQMRNSWRKWTGRESLVRDLDRNRLLCPFVCLFMCPYVQNCFLVLIRGLASLSSSLIMFLLCSRTSIYAKSLFCTNDYARNQSLAVWGLWLTYNVHTSIHWSMSLIYTFIQLSRI